MSQCPNCNQRLTLLNWKQTCPHCGINLVFYNFEERFFTDAKYTELGFAKVRVQAARLKAAYIGSRLAIARLVVCLLPVLAFLVPFSSQVFHLPMADERYSLGILGIVALLKNQALPFLLNLAGSSLVGDVFSLLLQALIGFAVTVLCAALTVLMTVACFLSIKWCARLACVFSALGMGGAVATSLLAGRFADTAAERMGSLVTVSNGFGVYAVVAAFAVVIVMNLLFLRQGVEIRYAEGDLYRVEIAKKLKRGEIALTDLPFPIFETDEEREARLAEEAADAAAEERRAEKQARQNEPQPAMAHSGAAKGGNES